MTQANGQNMAFTDWASASGYLQSLGNRGEPINQGGIPSAVIQGSVRLQWSAGFSLRASARLTSLDRIDVTTTAGAKAAITIENTPSRP